MNVKVVQYYFEDLMRRMQTDYIDIGMIHMIDNPNIKVVRTELIDILLFSINPACDVLD